MEHAVKVEERPALLVVSKRLPVRITDMGPLFGSSFGEIYAHLGARNVQPAGEPFVIYYEMPNGDKPIDIEICAPVTQTIDAPRGWKVRQLPAGTFASLVHVGPYDTVGEAYTAMRRWFDTHDLVVSGPPREVYLSPPETPPDQIRTVIEFPVVELGAPVGAPQR